MLCIGNINVLAGIEMRSTDFNIWIVWQYTICLVIQDDRKCMTYSKNNIARQFKYGKAF